MSPPNIELSISGFAFTSVSERPRQEHQARNQHTGCDRTTEAIASFPAHRHSGATRRVDVTVLAIEICGWMPAVFRTNICS